MMIIAIEFNTIYESSSCVTLKMICYYKLYCPHPHLVADLQVDLLLYILGCIHTDNVCSRLFSLDSVLLQSLIKHHIFYSEAFFTDILIIITIILS